MNPNIESGASMESIWKYVPPVDGFFGKCEDLYLFQLNLPYEGFPWK